MGSHGGRRRPRTPQHRQQGYPANQLSGSKRQRQEINIKSNSISRGLRATTYNRHDRTPGRHNDCKQYVSYEGGAGEHMGQLTVRGCHPVNPCAAKAIANFVGSAHQPNPRVSHCRLIAPADRSPAHQPINIIKKMRCATAATGGQRSSGVGSALGLTADCAGRKMRATTPAPARHSPSA